MVPLLLMEKRMYRWKLSANFIELSVWYTYGERPGFYDFRFYDNLFDNNDLRMLRWLLEETVNKKAVVRNGQIMYTQKKLGDIVWNKLGER